MRKARKPLCLLLCAVLLLSMSSAALGANNNYSSWFQTNYDEILSLIHIWSSRPSDRRGS